MTMKVFFDFLSQFINKVEHPDIDLQNFSQQSISITEQLSKLTEGINLLDKELQRQVLEKHEDLVSQATWVEKLQGVLSIMHIHVQWPRPYGSPRRSGSPRQGSVYPKAPSHPEGASTGASSDSDLVPYDLSKDRMSPASRPQHTMEDDQPLDLRVDHKKVKVQAEDENQNLILEQHRNLMTSTPPGSPLDEDDEDADDDGDPQGGRWVRSEESKASPSGPGPPPAFVFGHHGPPLPLHPAVLESMYPDKLYPPSNFIGRLDKTVKGESSDPLIYSSVGEWLKHAKQRFSLVSSVERVRMKVVDPFNRLETQTRVLSRLHSTTDLLRRAARIQQLAKRLPGAEPLKAAHILSELDELNRDVDLSGIEILEQEEKQIKKEAAITERKASKIIEQGLASMNQEMVGTGIEIMVKLGKAEVEVQKLMDRFLESVEASVKDALDMDTLVPPTTRGGAGRVAGVNIPANIQNFRSKLWTTWESTLTTHVFSSCAQMALVQNVLNKTISYSSLNVSTDDKSDIAAIFWNQVDDIMSKYLHQAAKGSSYMKQALEGEYPKLLRLHLDLHKKLKTLNPTETGYKPIFPPIGKCVKKFETAYLSRSVMLVLDAVRELFPEGEASPPQTPSTDKVDSLVKIISSELSVSLVDEALTVPVARNIAKAVSLFCQKGEQMVVNSIEATQVIEAPNASQELNVNVSNIVHYFCEQIKTVVSNLGLSKNVAAIILNAVEFGESLSQQILNPLLASILVAMESILLTMHHEDYNLTEYNASVSLHIRELQTFTARAVSTYLSPFQNQIQVANSCMEVASKAIGIFLRHATLVRPLSEEGKKKLSADFKTFEDAISPLCAQLSELGTIYSTLRSLRPLVTASTEEVGSSPVLGQVIPYSFAIMLLFSRGPPELPSPHESVGWTISKLSEWLDNHSNERDTLELLSGAVKKYEQYICAQKKSSFHDVYPTIKMLLEKGMKASTSRQLL